MNLGFLDGGTAAHEFNHAIGLGARAPEVPAGGIRWRRAGGDPRAWRGRPITGAETQTRHNIRASTPQTRSTAPTSTRKSVMLYFFPAGGPQRRGDLAQRGAVGVRQKVHRRREMYPRAKPGVTGEVTELEGQRRWRTAASIGKFGEEDVFHFRVTQPGATWSTRAVRPIVHETSSAPIHRPR